MRAIAGLAVTGMALTLALTVAMPAAARDRSADGAQAIRFVQSPARSRVQASQTVALESGDLVASEDPSAPRLFGSLPVADNLNVGVGLFSVVGSTEKEQMRRRQDPSREFRSSDTRVAAVGMSLRF